MARPDQKNLDRLLAHGKDKHGYSTSLIRITWRDGWIAGFEVEENKEYSKHALEFKAEED